MGQPPLSASEIHSELTTRGFSIVPRVSLNIEFEFDSTILTPAAVTQLDELARAIRSPTLRGRKFELSGHTDAVGSARYKSKLVIASR